MKTLQPALHFPSIDHPDALDLTARQLDHLASAGLTTPSVASLLCGATLQGTLLLSVQITSLAQLGAWAELLRVSAFTALATIASADLDRDPELAAALPLASGLGLVCASDGLDATPLIGLSIAPLRAAILTARDQLARAAAHPVLTLLARPDRFGRCLDPLLQQELLSAGYRRVLCLSPLPPTHHPLITRSRVVSMHDRPHELIRWCTQPGPRALIERALSATLF